MTIISASVQGRVRNWEGPEANFNAHRKEIVAWCEGKEIERHQQGANSLVWRNITTPSWDIDGVYRIAERKPKAGEVWENTLGPGYGLLCTKANGADVEFTELSNGQVEGFVIGTDDRFKFAAPSVEAYYLDKLRPVIAREIKQEVINQRIPSHHSGAENEAYRLAVLSLAEVV